MKKIGLLILLIIGLLTCLAIAVQVFPSIPTQLGLSTSKETPQNTPIPTTKKPEETPQSTPTSMSAIRHEPTEVVPSDRNMVGHSYPFCGESDVITAYYDTKGEKEAFLIPSCYQIRLYMSSSNLIIFDVVEEKDGWLRIKADPISQIFAEDVDHLKRQEQDRSYNQEINSILDGSGWIRTDQAFTAWTIRYGEKVYPLESLNPIAEKNADGGWNVYSTGICTSDEDKIMPGNNSQEPGLKMNVNYDPARDCGT